jgi:hypothetical protein
MAVTIGGREMGFSQGFRHGVVVVDEDERTVAECLSGEGVDNRDNTAIVNVLPLLDTSNCSRVAEPISCSKLVSAFGDFRAAYLRVGARHSSCRPPSEPCRPS